MKNTTKSDITFSYLIDGFEDVAIGSKQQGYTGMAFYSLNNTIMTESKILVSNYPNPKVSLNERVGVEYSTTSFPQHFLLQNQVELHYMIDGKEKVLLLSLEETTDVSFLY